MDNELKKKIERAQKGDSSVLNELVEENYGLVKAISRRFENRRIWDGGYLSNWS